MRSTGTVAVRRRSRPRRIRRRPSAASISKPPNRTSAPPTDSAQRTRTTAVAAMAISPGRVRSAVEQAAGGVRRGQVLHDDADRAGDGRQHAELRRGERADDRAPPAEPPRRLAARHAGRPERRAQTGGFPVIDGLQHDLRHGPPGDLHLRLHDAEQRAAQGR